MKFTLFVIESRFAHNNLENVDLIIIMIKSQNTAFYNYFSVTLFHLVQSKALLERNHALDHPSDTKEVALLHSQLFSQYHRPSETTRGLWLFVDHLLSRQRHRKILHSLTSRVSSLSSQQALNK